MLGQEFTLKTFCIFSENFTPQTALFTELGLLQKLAILIMLTVATTSFSLKSEFRFLSLPHTVAHRPGQGKGERRVNPGSFIEKDETQRTTSSNKHRLQHFRLTKAL